MSPGWQSRYWHIRSMVVVDSVLLLLRRNVQNVCCDIILFWRTTYEVMCRSSKIFNSFLNDIATVNLRTINNYRLRPIRRKSSTIRHHHHNAGSHPPFRAWPTLQQQRYFFVLTKNNIFIIHIKQTYTKTTDFILLSDLSDKKITGSRGLILLPVIFI